MYKQKTYNLNGQIIEQEYHYDGDYGCKGERRKKKQKPTTEQMEKRNQRNRMIRVRRLMRANFDTGDIFCTMKYRQDTKRTPEELKKDWRKFYDKISKYYKKHGETFKWIYRMEIGERGGCHIHILVNRIHGKDTDIEIQNVWNSITGGRVNFQPAYLEGGFEQLASYVTKKPDKKEYPKEYKQLSLLPEVERKVFTKYSASRNLDRPEPVEKKFSHWTMRKVLKDGIENIKPTPGYYIDKDSIVCGINPFTGKTYLYYTEYSLWSGERSKNRISTKRKWYFDRVNEELGLKVQ